MPASVRCLTLRPKDGRAKGVGAIVLGSTRSASGESFTAGEGREGARDERKTAASWVRNAAEPLRARPGTEGALGSVRQVRRRARRIAPTCDFGALSHAYQIFFFFFFFFFFFCGLRHQGEGKTALIALDLDGIASVRVGCSSARYGTAL